MVNPSESTSGRPGFLSLLVAYIKFFGSCLSLWGIGYMRFSPTWIALGSLGYFFIQFSRNRRVHLASSLKAIGENEKKFIVKHFSVRDLPSWVYFPDVERAEWFNKVVKRLWPFVSDYARVIILNNVSPAVSSQLPSALKPFEFLTLDLGDTPPRIGGVKVYTDENIKRDEIVMDLDLMLYSDARIKVQLGKVKAGVKEFELRGTLRVILKPLVPTVPFAGAVTVCFLDSPYISFALTDMGNLLGLPGLQQTLDTVIRNVVNQMIVLPNRLPVQLLENMDVQRLRYPIPQGVLRVNVVGARQLKVGDSSLIGMGSSDPYCIVRLGARTFQTAVVYKSLNPEWNEHFESIVDVRRGQFLSLEVYDSDKGNKDDHLGSASVALESVHDLGQLDTWVKLEGVKTGSVRLRLTWCTLSDLKEDATTAFEQALQWRATWGASVSAGFLYVVVEEAKNLKRLKQMREPSPYCNLLLGRDAQNTNIQQCTQTPNWESVHHFLVTDPHVDTLQIIVRDGRTETLLGRCRLPLKMLLDEERMSVTRPFPLEESGPDGAILFIHLEYKALKPRPKREFSTVDGSLDSEGLTGLSETIPEEIMDLSGPANTDLLSNESDGVVRHRTATTQLDPMANNSANQHCIQGSDGRTSMSEKLTETATSKHLASHLTMQFTDSVKHDSSNEPVGNPLGQVRLTLEYSSNLGRLSVTVHEARNLRGVDKDGLADPYVKMLLIGQRGAVKSERKTAPIKDTLNPVYEDSFDFNVEMSKLTKYGMRFDVKNHVGVFTKSGRTHQMGSVYIDLCKLVCDNCISDWFPLIPLDSVSTCDTRSLSPE